MSHAPLTPEAINSFLAREFPQAKVRVERVGGRASRVVLTPGDAELRPGGTISGPALMGVADCALYVAILGEIGLVPLAVTTSMSLNFLRKPPGGRRLIGECRLLKVGRTLAVGEVSVFSEGLDEPVMHATGTYSIPPPASRAMPAGAVPPR